MALLGYKQKNTDIIEFLCGGTVITPTYILTASHCVAEERNRELVTVRLGEHNLVSEIDCSVILGVKHCADRPVNFPVEKYIAHPNYNSHSLKNDIALVKVKSSIPFTDYIQPICMPFEENLQNRNLAGELFTISGWGKTNSRNVGGSSVLQFAYINVWKQTECNDVVPPEVQPVTDNQLCANGKKEDACKGDSGGPLFNQTLDPIDKLRTYQFGIVSFASTITCGVEELPAIYTRVDRYLDWIVENIQIS